MARNSAGAVLDGNASVDKQRLSRVEEHYGRALFARGFLLCRDRPSYVPHEWVADNVGWYQLFRDPRVPLHRFRDEWTELILLGDAFDLRDPARTNEEIAADLFRALVQSRQHLHELTDWLHGRHVLIYRYLPYQELQVFSDATGIRAVFHTADGTCVGSHASLVAVNGDKPYRPRPHGRFGFPGRTTVYEDVLVLVPNHELRVGSGEITRFFPRTPLEPLPSEAVAEQASRWLRNAITGIVTRHPHPIASLTAGLDSRTTLAVSRAVTHTIRFFTYYRGDDVETDWADRSIAQQLAATLGLQHRVLMLKDYWAARPENFGELCDALSPYRHLHKAALVYMQLFDPDKDVHLRSNLSEIGRSFYLKTKHITHQLRSGRDLAQAYVAFAPQRVSKEALPSIIDDFERYFDDTSFSEVEGLRDTRDMLYWEHRMGVWHSLAVLESDPAFQTYSIFNARKILDVLMSAPEADRAAGTHMKQIIARNWPECLDFPFNPTSNGRTSPPVASAG